MPQPSDSIVNLRRAPARQFDVKAGMRKQMERALFLFNIFGFWLISLHSLLYNMSLSNLNRVNPYFVLAAATVIIVTIIISPGVSMRESPSSWRPRLFNSPSDPPYEVLPQLSTQVVRPMAEHDHSKIHSSRSRAANASSGD